MASTSASSPLGGKAAAGQGLFTRQTSGLVRELGIPAATGISLASVAVVNTFINFNAGLTDFAKADMYLPLRSEEHTSELQSQSNLVCRLLLEKKKNYIL